MTGEAYTDECFRGDHDECRDDIRGYQGMHVACSCTCHRKAQR